jgi:hypothetical protein
MVAAGGGAGGVIAAEGDGKPAKKMAESAGKKPKAKKKQT